MAKFEELNKKQIGNKPNDTKKGNKPFKRRPEQVAAIKSGTIVTIQQSSFDDSIGNTMDYNEDDLMSDYIASPRGMTQCVEIANHNPSQQLILNANDAIATAPRFLRTTPNFANPQMALRNQNCALKTMCKPSILSKIGYRGPAPGDNRIAVPILIQGKTRTALLDPGSTHSIIDKVVASDLRIKCSTLADQTIELGEAGTLVKKVITNDRVNLICNTRAVDWQVSVMNLGYYDFLIGMDLFPRFGFQLGGFTTHPQRRDEVLVVDEKPSIVASTPAAIEQQASFMQRKETFLKKIEEALQNNAKIDSKSHCPLEIMRVELKVKEGCTIQERSRRFYAEAERAEVDTTVKKWLDNGIIVPALKGNPYNNSLTLAARRNLEGVILKYRVCLDPRKLNNQLVETDNFPLPIINDILEKVAGHKYFTTLDLSQAYHRLPLDEKSRPYTAFTYNDNQYMFARAPFGLKPTTSIFQRGMAQLLGDLHFVAVYVDDIVIFSNTMEEHLEHVKAVIDRLTKAKLIVNKEKSHFLRTQVVLLGFLVDAKGKRINPEKVANVKSWAPPTNGKMVQRYLGMFNYFREYIPLYSTIAAPLDRLRNVKGSFKLNELEMKCFELLKRLITEAPVLCFPDFSLPFYVATDASNLGIGVVLYQLPNGDESKVNYISFMARSLKPHEKNYPAYKKELLGVIYACKKFHYYLWGRKFTLYTDHRPLTYIHEQNELPQIIADWKETLFSYNFDCVYRPGLLNIIPDALSRAFPEELWSTRNSEPSTKDGQKIAAVAARNFRRLMNTSDKPVTSLPTELNMVPAIEPVLEPIDASSEETIAEPATAPSMDTIMKAVDTSSEETLAEPTVTMPSETTDEPISSAEMAEQLSQTAIGSNATYIHDIQDQPLYRQVTDETEQKRLLKEAHSFGHPGANAMVAKLHQQGVTWPKLKEACINLIRSCSACQHFNVARKGYHPLKAIHATLPGEHIAMDLAHFPTSNAGNNYALLVVDVCSRFVFLEPLKEKSAITVAGLLFKLFCAIGFPKIIQSDQGTEFVNAIAETLTARLNIEKRVTTPYHPRANGVAERNVRTMKNTLKKELDGKIADWDLHLPKVQLIMNTRIASLHGSTPFSLFYGRTFPGLADFRSVRSDLASPEQLKERLEYLTNLVYPAISEKSKQTQKRMIEKFNASHYLTEFPDGSSFAPEQLKHAAPPDEEDDDVCTDNNGDNKTKHYTVERIISHRTDEADDKVYYMVKFEGYTKPEEINFEHFDSKKMVHQYHKALNQENPHVVAKRAKRPQATLTPTTRSSKRLKRTA